MMTIQEHSSSTLGDFTGLVENLHNIIDAIASQVVDTVGARDPSLVSDRPSPPAPSELARKVNVDESRLRGFAISSREIFEVYIFVFVSRTRREDACE